MTVDDYRRILFSEIAEIENVWLEKSSAREKTCPSGLYRILAAPVPGIRKSKKTEQRLKETIQEVYARHRNLCEDIDEIVLLRPVA